MKPVYNNHDICDRSDYLGTILVESIEYDVYFVNNSLGGSVLMRYSGDDPADYGSGSMESFLTWTNTNPVCRKALELMIHLGRFHWTPYNR